jgi:hypothetical protein
LTGQSKNRLNRKSLSDKIEMRFAAVRAKPESSRPAASCSCDFGIREGASVYDPGQVWRRSSPNRHTRQFLPGELLINEMEILRICRVSFSESAANKLN